jgi:hypothetical protein
MKRTLRESLVDHDMALLRAVAEMRGALLNSNHRLKAVEELAEQLASPASLAIALGELSADETRPLAALRAAGGWMKAPRFARRFGAVRVMGPGRLERERPWLSPDNPAEALWYRALIFKGFRQADSGVVEVVYIPEDVLALLPDLSPEKLAPGEEESGFHVEPAAPPPRIQTAGRDVVEDVFAVLVTVRNHGARFNPTGGLHIKDLQAINALCVSPVPPANAADDDRLALIVHLCMAAGLATRDRDRLALLPDPARAWLHAPPAEQLLALQVAWRDATGWNDLWHVPSLKPQPTGWTNDPVLARRQVLRALSACRPDEWYRLDEWVNAVKSWQPDFQRPDGDYTTWYIHDLRGQALIGFERWDEVEGALLRYLVRGPLYWLSVVDAGFEEEERQASAFRVAAAGLPLLRLIPAARENAEATPQTEPGAEPGATAEDLGHAAGPGQAGTLAATVEVREDFTIWMARDASLYTQFQLARFADFVAREADRVGYRISPLSLARARRQGITPEQIGAFLARSSQGGVPARVTEGLRSWYTRAGSAWLEEGVVLRVDRPETLKAMREHPALASLLGEVLGPQAVLVPRANLGQVRRWLLRQGYLDGR